MSSLVKSYSHENVKENTQQELTWLFQKPQCVRVNVLLPNETDYKVFNFPSSFTLDKAKRAILFSSHLSGLNPKDYVFIESSNQDYNLIKNRFLVDFLKLKSFDNDHLPNNENLSLPNPNNCDVKKFSELKYPQILQFPNTRTPTRSQSLLFPPIEKGNEENNNQNNNSLSDSKDAITLHLVEVNNNSNNQLETLKLRSTSRLISNGELKENLNDNPGGELNENSNGFSIVSSEEDPIEGSEDEEDEVVVPQITGGSHNLGTSSKSTSIPKLEYDSNSNSKYDSPIDEVLVPLISGRPGLMENSEDEADHVPPSLSDNDQPSSHSSSFDDQNPFVPNMANEYLDDGNDNGFVDDDDSTENRNELLSARQEVDKRAQEIEKYKQTINELQDKVYREEQKRRSLEQKIFGLQEKINQALIQINSLLDNNLPHEEIVERMMSVLRTLELDLRQMLDPNQRLWMKIKTDIIEAEEKFVNNVLLTIKRVYHDPLLELEILTANDFNDIFADFTTFYERQVAFLAKCKTLHAHGEEIGLSILDRINEMHGFSFFFITKYNQTVNLLARLKKNNPKFRKFMLKREYKLESNNVSLEDLLRMPVDHFAYFQLLLEKYLNLNPHEDSNFQLVSTIIEQMERFVLSIKRRQEQSYLREEQNQLQSRLLVPRLSTVRLYHLLGFNPPSTHFVDFIKPGRILQRRGELILYDSERKQKEYSYILCNDLLVQTRLKPSGTFYVRRVLSLHEARVGTCTVTQPPNLPPLWAFIVESTRPSLSAHILCARSEVDRNDWLFDIVRAIESLQVVPRESGSLRNSLTTYPRENYNYDNLNEFE